KSSSLIQPSDILIIVFLPYHILDKGFSVSFRKKEGQYRSQGDPHIIIYKSPYRPEDQDASQTADSSRKNRDHYLDTLDQYKKHRRPQAKSSQEIFQSFCGNKDPCTDPVPDKQSHCNQPCYS